MKPKNITNDELAAMIQKGFAETATKSEMNRVDKQVTQVRHEMVEFRNDVDERFTYVQQELRSVRKEL